jgi:hypothetical protein
VLLKLDRDTSSSFIAASELKPALELIKQLIGSNHPEDKRALFDCIQLSISFLGSGLAPLWCRARTGVETPEERELRMQEDSNRAKTKEAHLFAWLDDCMKKFINGKTLDVAFGVKKSGGRPKAAVVQEFAERSLIDDFRAQSLTLDEACSTTARLRVQQRRREKKQRANTGEVLASLEQVSGNEIGLISNESNRLVDAHKGKKRKATPLPPLAEEMRAFTIITASSTRAAERSKG